MYQNLSGDNTDQLPCYLLPLKSDKGKVLGLIILSLVHRTNHLRHKIGFKSSPLKLHTGSLEFAKIPLQQCQTAQNVCEYHLLCTPKGNITRLKSTGNRSFFIIAKEYQYGEYMYNSVTNSSKGLIFVKIRAKYEHIFSKNTSEIQAKIQAKFKFL